MHGAVSHASNNNTQKNAKHLTIVERMDRKQSTGYDKEAVYAVAEAFYGNNTLTKNNTVCRLSCETYVNIFLIFIIFFYILSNFCVNTTFY